jgi:transposase
MIHLNSSTRIFLSVTPADFRCQIDGLAAVCRQVFEEDPESGSVFVFRNRVGTSLKLLMFDGHGYWLVHRRLSKGKIQWWPSAECTHSLIDPQELMVLLWNGNPKGVFAEPWKKVDVEKGQGKKQLTTPGDNPGEP